MTFLQAHVQIFSIGILNWIYVLHNENAGMFINKINAYYL